MNVLAIINIGIGLASTAINLFNAVKCWKFKGFCRINCYLYLLSGLACLATALVYASFLFVSEEVFVDEVMELIRPIITLFLCLSLSASLVNPPRQCPNK